MSRRVVWTSLWPGETPSPRPGQSACEASALQDPWAVGDGVGSRRWTWDDRAAAPSELAPRPDEPRRRTWDDQAPSPPDTAWVARPAPAPPPDAPRAAPPSGLALHASALPLATRPQILLAEPDHTTARVLQHRLQSEGMAVTAVAEAETALEHLRLGGLDLLLLDADLPGGAFEVLRQVRSGPTPDLPIIVLGWPGNDLVAVRAFGLGTDDVVTRPFSLAEAVARVQYQIARRGPGS